METADAILARRSVRAFSDRPVSRELLSSLVEAAAWAPTASNVQAWRFCVVDDPDLVRKLDMVSPGLSGKPPVIVVALSDRDYARAKGGAKAAEEFAALDAAYACENLMLAAADAGLGTCAIKSYNDAAVRSLLGVPENLVVELLISLGYPDPAKAPRAPKRKPLGEVLHFNECTGWGTEAEGEEVRSDELAECDGPDDEAAECSDSNGGAANKLSDVLSSKPGEAPASAPGDPTSSSSEAAPKETFHPTLSAALAASPKAATATGTEAGVDTLAPATPDAAAAAAVPSASDKLAAAITPAADADEAAATTAADDLELLAYMVTSAAGLRGEPAIYGPLRLIESSKRVALQTADALRPADPARSAALTSLATLIAERQNDCMTDEESFYAMLNEAAALLAQAL